MEELYETFLGATGVCTDTRKLKAGNLFFALKGPNFDGNQYAHTALEGGATHAVVDDPTVVVSHDYTLVDDVLVALQDLANHHRKQSNAKIISITGSNGKTTTKELTAKVLGCKYEIIFTQGNLNNHIGVPLTLLNIKPSTQIAVVEMGANHVGEIADLCKIAEPSFGLITNIGKAHLEGFGSLEGVKKGKGELYASIKKNEGVLFVNNDLEHLENLAGDYPKVVRYSVKENFQKQVPISFGTSQNQIALSLEWDGKESSVDLQLYGAYNISNILAALNIGHYFDISPLDGIRAMSNYFPKNNRSQKVKTARNTVYLDSYNANPTSMEHALRAFKSIEATDKIVVLGDMFELGTDAALLHEEIAQSANELFDEVILIGENFAITTPDVHKFSSKSSALEFIANRSLKGHTILLKGSRGMALEQFLDVL